MQSIKNIILINKESEYINLIPLIFKDKGDILILYSGKRSSMVTTAFSVQNSLMTALDQKLLMKESHFLDIGEATVDNEYIDLFDALDDIQQENIVIVANSMALLVVNMKLKSRGIDIPVLYPLKTGEIRYINIEDKKCPQVFYVHQNEDRKTSY